MTDVSLEVGERVGFWMRREWPRNTAKEAARAFNTHVSTAEKWLSGQLPSNRHMLQMMQAWGRRFVEFVYEPAVGTELKAYALGEELDAIKSHIARLERDLDAAASYQVRAQTDGAGDAESGPVERDC